MKFYIVDAFTEQLFGGNPAGVVLLPEDGDFPSDEICIKTAAELRYSETAFIKDLGGGEFQIRYFTPVDEVELCGHATIGSFAALRYGGHIDDGEYINHTISGDLNIGVEGNSIMMDMAEPVVINELRERGTVEELYNIMGLNYKQVECNGELLPVQLISTGLPDIMMPVSTLESLEKIAPDFDALAKLSDRYEVVGVHAFTLDGDDATCHVRNFAPLYGINEEAATGTSNGALTYYGYINGFIKSGDKSRFIQGEKMQRPSVIESTIEAEGDNCLIRVGGSAVVLSEGEINLIGRKG